MITNDICKNVTLPTAKKQLEDCEPTRLFIISLQLKQRVPANYCDCFLTGAWSAWSCSWLVIAASTLHWQRQTLWRLKNGIGTPSVQLHRWHLESLHKKVTLEVACWLWLGCWSNNVANSHLILVHSTAEYCAKLWLDTCILHQQTIFLSHKHPTCWASSQWSHSGSSTLCHGTLTSAPLSAHLSIEWECTTSQIETPILYLLLNNSSVLLMTKTVSVVECRKVGVHYKTPTPYFQPTLLEWHCHEQCAVVLLE